MRSQKVMGLEATQKGNCGMHRIQQAFMLLQWQASQNRVASSTLRSGRLAHGQEGWGAPEEPG